MECKIALNVPGLRETVDGIVEGEEPFGLIKESWGNSDPRLLFWRPFDVYTNASGAIKCHTNQPKLLATGACSQLTDFGELDSVYNAGAFWQHFFACAIPSVPKHLSK